MIKRLFHAWLITFLFATCVRGQPLVIGVEYAFSGMADAFAKAGIRGVKCFPDVYEWGDMQKKAGGPIDFSRTDRYVKEYQEKGFNSLVMALRSQCSWGSVNKKKDASPKPEHLEEYKKWVSAIVERYDHDGKDDMPGLVFPVRYYEIGTEFSSYEPEPVDRYIPMLSAAYGAAHNAYADVLILHAALLTTTAVNATTQPEQITASFDSAFARQGTRIQYHSLSEIRKLLDHPEIFDIVNFHNIGDPYEIEGIVRWLNWEMKKRNYSKPLLISDTSPTPFISWGNAVDCDKPRKDLGIVVPPFEESDRCRISEFFKKVIANDPKAMEWLYGFYASDLVKKCVVAASMGVRQIDMAFVEDIFFMKMGLFKAGAGTAGWSGMLETKADAKTDMRTVTGYRPVYYALMQVQNVLGDYASVERVDAPDPHFRIYKIIKGGRQRFICWYEPDKIPLMEDAPPKMKYNLKTDLRTFTIETLVQKKGQTSGDRQTKNIYEGVVQLELTDAPLFIY
jgi:hypothetical protein